MLLTINKTPDIFSNMNTIEIELDDGTVARWVVPANKADEVYLAIEAILGQPDTTKL